jgi:hypothetical protein
MELLANVGRPKTAREKRHALRLSRRGKVVRWIGAANRKRMRGTGFASHPALTANPSAEVVVLTWEQTFGRPGPRMIDTAFIPAMVPCPINGTTLLAFRRN